MADDLTNRGAQDRSRISMSEDHEVRYWTKELGVTREQLQRAVDKVGNSAAAVRKELGSKLVPILLARLIPSTTEKGAEQSSRALPYSR